MNLVNIFNFVYNGEQKAEKLGVREKYDVIGNLGRLLLRRGWQDRWTGGTSDG
ncbi:hypothetical protein QUF84_20240 [Fictibacillus enclensis]|uniref:hypothetical protein n=1 Tax=Fictibacillus enclensis TaxID=1017270 RepID=UPI0025A173D6|nr:hypothetical protein [Fictibacillus enclensis]MDM5339533.1 hypothetical protein [Fictibacillus enclensis]